MHVSSALTALALVSAVVALPHPKASHLAKRQMNSGDDPLANIIATGAENDEKLRSQGKAAGEAAQAAKEAGLGPVEQENAAAEAAKQEAAKQGWSQSDAENRARQAFKGMISGGVLGGAGASQGLGDTMSFPSILGEGTSAQASGDQTSTSTEATDANGVESSDACVAAGSCGSSSQTGQGNNPGGNTTPDACKTNPFGPGCEDKPLLKGAEGVLPNQIEGAIPVADSQQAATGGETGLGSGTGGETSSLASNGAETVSDSCKTSPNDPTCQSRSQVGTQGSRGGQAQQDVDANASGSRERKELADPSSRRGGEAAAEGANAATNGGGAGTMGGGASASASGGETSTSVTNGGETISDSCKANPSDPTCNSQSQVGTT
ncbi:MAG: hypothetical protein M1833_004727 [Piccolia ochrophora]|nr:MAG: hypothetical protein M1833_004727 [Piccolia ochrophora]